MYDIYRNALIIFDHNIKPSVPGSNDHQIAPNSLPSEKTEENSRRKTPLIPYPADKNTTDKTVYNHTKDMYGDGYVLIYNVIPDGKTLTFVKKQFDPTSGINTKTNEKTNDTYRGNYSQNIIRLEDVPLDYIWKYFNTNHFTKNNGTIELKSTPGGGGGGGGTDLSVLDEYSLGNIYKSFIAHDTILAAGSDGKIMANSSIPLECLRGYPSNKSSIDARLTALENNSSGDMSEYATRAELAYIENLIESYHSPESDGGGVMHIQIFTGAPNQSGDSSMPVTDSTTGTFNLKTAIENGGVRLHGNTSTSNRLFAPPCDGFIVGSMVAAELR